MGKRNISIAAMFAAAAMAGAAQAQTITVKVDSDYADFLLAKTCSGEDIDEAAVAAMPLVQSQIKHHSNMGGGRDMAAFLAGLKAAAKCAAPENDAYEFGALVANKSEFRAVVDYFKNRAPEIEAYVSESLAPFVPATTSYNGELVLSIVGNNCGGFSMDGKFYLALSCIRTEAETEFEAAKLIASHETYHALQYDFFAPFDEDISHVKTRDEAFEYLFMNLLLEGSAEFVADSSVIDGRGTLSGILRRFARTAHRQMPYLIRLFGYSADILDGGDDIEARIEDVYSLGFGGQNGQIFYYAGAAMVKHVDETYGRDALICIMSKPPEQFVRAYDAAARANSSEERPALSAAMRKAADRLSRKRAKDQRFEACIP